MGDLVRPLTKRRLGTEKAKLLLELIPATAGQVGGYFRVRSEEEILSFALFGDLASESISVIPSQ